MIKFSPNFESNYIKSLNPIITSVIHYKLIYEYMKNVLFKKKDYQIYQCMQIADQ